MNDSKPTTEATAGFVYELWHRDYGSTIDYFYSKRGAAGYYYVEWFLS